MSSENKTLDEIISESKKLEQKRAPQIYSEASQNKGKYSGSGGGGGGGGRYVQQGRTHSSGGYSSSNNNNNDYGNRRPRQDNTRGGGRQYSRSRSRGSSKDSSHHGRSRNYDNQSARRASTDPVPRNVRAPVINNGVQPPPPVSKDRPPQPVPGGAYAHSHHHYAHGHHQQPIPQQFQYQHQQQPSHGHHHHHHHNQPPPPPPPPPQQPHHQQQQQQPLGQAAKKLQLKKQSYDLQIKHFDISISTKDILEIATQNRSNVQVLKVLTETEFVNNQMMIIATISFAKESDAQKVIENYNGSELDNIRLSMKLL